MEDEIWLLWQDGYTYEDISNMMLSPNLSLKSIRNIIYNDTAYNEYGIQLKRLYTKMKKELGSGDSAIRFIYANQPLRKAPGVRRIKQIINANLYKK